MKINREQFPAWFYLDKILRLHDMRVTTPRFCRAAACGQRSLCSLCACHSTFPFFKFALILYHILPRPCQPPAEKFTRNSLACGQDFAKAWARLVQSVGRTLAKCGKKRVKRITTTTAALERKGKSAARRRTGASSSRSASATATSPQFMIQYTL